MTDNEFKDLFSERSGGNTGVTMGLIEAYGQLPPEMLEVFCKRHSLTGVPLWEDYMKRKAATTLSIYPFAMYVLEVATEILRQDAEKDKVAAQ